MNGLLRALAYVAGGFLRSVTNLLGGLLRRIANVTSGLAHLVAGGRRALLHVVRRTLGFLLDVDCSLVHLFADFVQPTRLLNAAVARASRVRCNDRVIGARDL